MRIILYFLVIAFLGLLATLASAQSSGDLILQYKGSSGASLQYLTPSTGTGIPAFNGASPNRIELLPRSTFATPADVAAYAQPLDADLTTLAEVTSTATGRNLLSASSATAAKTVLGMGPTGGLSCLGLQVIQSPTEFVPGFFAFIDATQTHVVKVGANAAPTSSFTIDLPTAAGEWLTSGSSLNASNIISGSLALARIAQGGATVGQALAWNGTEYAPTTFTNAVTSVAGRTGAITLSTSDISGLGTIATQASDALALTASATLTRNLLGTTPTNGWLLTNTTAATSGAQQISPSLTLTGQGWKTTATAASQSVAFSQYALPVQGTTAPTGLWTLAASINGGADTTVLQGDSRGFIIVNPANSNESTPNIRGDAAGTYGISISNGQMYFRSYSTNCFGVYNGGIQLPGTIAFNTSAVGGAFGLVLSREANNNLQLGEDAATPAAVILSGADATGTNGTGGDLVAQPGNGTGSGKSGKWVVETAPPGSSGSTPTTMTRRMEIDEQGVIKINNATTVPAVDPAGGGYLFSEGGALKWRGSSGTVTTIANP